MSDIDRQSLMEVFTFETQQYLEQLEQIVISADRGYTEDIINEIFRIMHTIKGGASMMFFNSMATASHALEDLFYYLREQHPSNLNNSQLTDHVLESVDFLKDELTKIMSGAEADGNPSVIASKVHSFLADLKNADDKGASSAKKSDQPAQAAVAEPISESPAARVYDAVVTFIEGSEMENVRAYTLVYNIKNLVDSITYEPEDLIDESAIAVIRENGFKMVITTERSYDTIYNYLAGTVYAKDIYLEERKSVANNITEPDPILTPAYVPAASQPVLEPPASQQVQSPAPVQAASQSYDQTADSADGNQTGTKKAPVQSAISVNVNKLDKLLNLVGELVIAEAMVTQNPDLEGLELENFMKETRQLRKIVADLQNTIMSTRMITIGPTFFKMNRIVRDMSKQLGKEVTLTMLGEDTEVDKNIIEHISDPIMHIIRNAMDHGIETVEARRAVNKPDKGQITLEAKSIGSDVLISISDDGCGLDKDKILAKAERKGLLRKPAGEYSDKEIFQFVFLPGFSTNEVVTSYSGRGVGMDVVLKNLETVGGITTIDSVAGEGSTFTMKIPLTMAIRKGMIIKMGDSKYTVEIDAIRNSFKPSRKDMFTDPNGNEMITVYGEHYNIVKLYEFFDTPSAYRDIEDGIMMIIENGDDKVCLFVDELVCEQSVVVKNLPKYIGKVPGLSGCTLLGNGDISLIIDATALFDR